MSQVGDGICCSPRHAAAAGARLGGGRPLARARCGAGGWAADAVRCKQLHQACGTTTNTQDNTMLQQLDWRTHLLLC